jgi:ATP-binding cassette subfamily B protein
MFVGRGFMMLISAILMLLGTIIIMFAMNWRLSLILTIVIFVVFFMFAIFVRRIMPVALEVQKKLGILNTILQENLAGLRVVKAFAREEFETERYLNQNQELLHENINLAKLFSSIFPMVFFVANQGVVVVVWYGGLQVISNHLTLGELVAFNGYILFLLMPIFQMGMLGAMLSRAEASAVRIFEVLDAKSEIEDKPGAETLPPIKGEVEFSNVCFRYVGADQNVIDDISFQARVGDTIAILGQTGAGKSSIINLIPRFYDVTSGKITVDSIDIRDVTLESLRSQIGIVLQETTLFSGSIRDNISYGRPDASLEEVVSAAKAAQAHEFISEYPDGYETIVGERGVGLSGGQKQRVAIARALLVNPRILILDDSTSSVDAETEYHIQLALESLMEDRTSFVIAQRISTVRNADKILVLENGRLTAEGQHEDLLKSNELYVEILETQFGERAEVLPMGEEEKTS